ncbi:CDP-glycerol glycerophosphotransferase family protein [Thermophilibacter provencensis]|uniref:CDP-glycerol glycerophosphotransferase family protein n=1 Tax=Thermophilibacter provencensis TaxID=1852386 RepID=A0ABT7V1I8_9ACTN|nr:CDP-glycerol glycerophosphotransferase family protein [Thermophilibacter provencensis]MDM8270479.1 CDP-glycerol glycerophosphotransferase family protein [Thermophilibacter provencensis]
MALSRAALKKRVKSLAKTSYFARSTFNSLQDYRRRRYFRSVAKDIPIDDKLVIFESFLGRQYACSPRAIYEAMRSDPRFDDYRFIWVSRKPDDLRKRIGDERTTVVKYLTRSYLRAYARAKFWVTNWRLPAGLCKREGQVVIQTWHGTPLKKIGMDLTIEGNATTSQRKGHRSYLNDAKKYDFFVSPSAFCTRVFASAFGLTQLGKENVLVETGYPRNDRLFSFSREDVDDIKQRLGIEPGKRVILYAPTWRDNQHTLGVGYTFDPVEHLERFLDSVPDDSMVIVRLHYLVANKVNLSAYRGKVIDCSRWEDINDLYIVSDVLITDYSSVFFDYANLRRPILFYMYDLQEYSSSVRDFYIDLDELPGPIIETQEELIDALANTEKIARQYADKYQTFIDTYDYLDDAHAGLRVAERCILGIEG